MQYILMRYNNRCYYRVIFSLKNNGNIYWKFSFEEKKAIVVFVIRFICFYLSA